MTWLHQLRNRPWLAVSLMLPGLLLRTAIPPGFMPSSTRGTPFAMEMCPGHASVPLAAPAGNGTVPNPSGKHHDAPCVFAAASGLAPVPFAAIVTPVGLVSELHVLLRTPPPPARHAARANAPRAPPVRG